MSSSPPTHEPTPFGHQMRKHFLFGPGHTQLNHGSYGALPRPVLSKLHSIHTEFELSADHFIRHKSHPYLVAARRSLATLINAPLNETVMIQNVTGAVNTVLRNLKWDKEKKDTIVFFETAFVPCQKGVASVVEMEGVEARKVRYQFPISHEEIVRRFLEVVRAEGRRVRVAIFETVVSVPGVRFPFERLVECCREEGILSLVDGAHGVGMIPLDLEKLGADFFVSCAHKWLNSPRGTCVFHVPLRNQHLLRTTFPTSHGFVPNPPPHLASTFSNLSTAHAPDSSPFETLFERVATMDMAPFFSVPEAVKFRREVCGGEDAVMKYCVDVAREGGDKGAEVLGTEVMHEEGLDGESSKLRDCPFANLRLPIAVAGSSSSEEKGRLLTIEKSEVGKVTKWIEEKLVFEMNTFVPVFSHGGWLWCRVSGQIYVEVGDFEWLAKGLKGLCERVAKGEWKGEE